MTSIVTQTETPLTVCIGIDWADKLHAFHLLGPDQSIQFGTCQQDAQTIDAQLAQWRAAYPGATFEIAIEQTKGPLISALLKHADIVIYPVNPAAAASYRKAFKHGGGKNDPTDAMLLCQYLQHYRDQLRPLRHEQPLTRELAALAEDRRRLVDQRTALCNELKDVLKRYFPEVLKLGAAKIYADFLLAFLIKYPSLGQAKKAGATRLRKFFFCVGAKLKAEQRVQLLQEAISLSDDEVLIRACGRRVVALARVIQTYNQQVRIYDKEIGELVCQHADYEIYASLPGAADLTHCRMVAAMGDDRSRYADAASLQAATGIAPLTTQSGNQQFVSSRWACTKFLRQTFHEFAGLTITKSKWAGAFYKQQLANGKSSQMAKRALAYKWQRIIFRCWQSRKPYDEARYIEQLRKNGSPLFKLIATPTK